jgi:hypothetical protein
MEPETHRGPELQQDAEGQLVFTGRLLLENFVTLDSELPYSGQSSVY